MQVTETNSREPVRSLEWRELAGEPFRLFFPLGVIAGIAGVMLWPLHFLGVGPYPGVGHARVMAHGFLGSFICGFLATAVPRMLGASPISLPTVASLLVLQTLSVGGHLAGWNAMADGTFLAALLVLTGSLADRFRRRTDLPPPGFTLALLGILCAMVGLALGFAEAEDESAATRLIWQNRLVYQGFLLLPILGVGGYILPEMLGVPNRHDLPGMRLPSAEWWRLAAEAAVAGGLVVLSFGLEVRGWVAAGYGLRGAAAGGYLLRQLWSAGTGTKSSVVARWLRFAMILVVSGFALVALFPGVRVAWLHLFFAGGMSMVTLAVATRVLFGHSGQGPRLHGRNAWLTVAFVVMILATLTRITGDLLPKILVTHYSYGAVFWATALSVWAWKALPAAMRADGP